MQIVLASKSPRRKELLAKITDSFIIDVSEKEEKCPSFIENTKKSEYLAIVKAKDVYKRHKNALVIGADTTVLINNEVLGKPKDKEDARRMINMLSGNTHIVVTGVCLKSKKHFSHFTCVSRVTFRKMSEKEIEDYICLDTIYDKAGAYAIQNEAKEYITGIEGEYENIVGLPIHTLKKYIEQYKNQKSQ